MAAWAAMWVLLALLIASEVRGLGDLSRTVTSAGAAVEASGRLMQRLGSLPVVGRDIEASADRVAAAGRRAQAGGRSSRRSVRRLSVLLGLTIAVLPSAPLVLYVPWRVRLARDRRALRRTLSRERPGDEGVLELLARRAAERLPYHRLLEVSADPWQDIRDGRHRQLALAELARLGMTPDTMRRRSRRR